jgi:AcrR family transcriptional regulator
MLDNRSRIIEAAARVYAAHGYRGATTRRIAEEAGVNEVTLFRQFGSKSALLDAMVEECLGMRHVGLPEVPNDPEAELTLWVTAHMRDLVAKRDLLQHVMRDTAEHPDHATCATQGPAAAADQLRAYVVQLRRHGWLDTDPVTEATVLDVSAAVTMLMAAFFVDAMDRVMMPSLFTTPAAEAPRSYVRVFLRGIGLRATPDGASDPSPERAFSRTVPVPAPSSSIT